MSGSFIRGRTNQQSLDEVADVTGGAIHVDAVGPAGTVSSYSMNADTNITTTNAFEVWSDTTGCKKALLYFAPPSAATGYIVVGWSTDADDAADINTIIDAKTTSRAANSGAGDGTGVTSVKVVYPTHTNINPVVLSWDGTTTIKTIVCESHAPASAADLAYELVVIQ